MTDRDQLAGFATAVAEKVAPIAAAGDEGRVNRRLIRALADEGLLPGLFPRRAGGTSEAGVLAGGPWGGGGKTGGGGNPPPRAGVGHRLPAPPPVPARFAWASRRD